MDRLMDRFGVSEIDPVFDLSHGNAELKGVLGLGRYVVLTLPATIDTQEALLAYTADPEVELAEPDFVGRGAGVPDDASFSQQWNLNNSGQQGGTVDADVDAPEAWDITVGTDATVLAVIDTGVDLDHPELAGKLLAGYDFVNGDADPQDDYGHGTHVAGIAAADTNNGGGIAGLCWRCRIMPVKALNNENWGYYTWWAAAIEYAVDNGADAINMSMGGTGFSQILLDAVRYAYNMGVPIGAAMMNDGNSTPYYPAAYPETIAVGSTDRYDSRSSFSNYGQHIDLVAPGTDILSTMWDDDYAIWSGTSMATPHVVAVLGLIMSSGRDYSIETLRAILRQTTDDQVGPSSEDTPGWDPYFGAGRLNAAHAAFWVSPTELYLPLIANSP